VTQAKVAIVTHGTPARSGRCSRRRRPGSQDLGSSAVKVTPGLREQRRVEAVAGVNAAIAAKVHVIATSVPDAGRAQGSALACGVPRDRGHHGELGPRGVRQPQDLHDARWPDRGHRRARRRQAVHGSPREEPRRRHPRGEQLGPDTAGGRRQEDLQGAAKNLLIPNATSDLPGLQAKLRAYFRANPKTDALLGLNPDVTTAALARCRRGRRSARST